MPVRCARGALVLGLAGSLSGCPQRDEAGGSTAAVATEAAPASAAPAVSAPRPHAPEAEPPAPPALPDPNPLRLPPRKIELDAGRRVFTFPDTMLAGAKLGSTLVLQAATVAGYDGDDLLVEGKGGPPYKVHAGYVIRVPDEPRIRVGDAVLTEHNGLMKHAVVTKLSAGKTAPGALGWRGKVTVRYTDVDARAPENVLKGARTVKQVEGLSPGNYAAARDGDAWRHVLLVSPVDDGSKKQWLALGFAGAVQIVAAGDLKPIPIRFKGKVGDLVWAESLGRLRRATIQAVVEPAFFTVRYERAGRPVTLGWGFLTKPLDG